VIYPTRTAFPIPIKGRCPLIRDSNIRKKKEKKEKK